MGPRPAALRAGRGPRAQAGGGRADCGAPGGPALAALAWGCQQVGAQQGRTLAAPLPVTHLSV